MSDAAISEPDIAHYQRVLARMVDLAEAVAHKLAARIDDATPAEAINLAKAVDVVARIVRRTILLSVHLHKAAEKAAQIRATARTRIIRDVSDTIFRDRLAPEKAETLRVELVERLDAPDLAAALDVEIATRPLADIILDLKRDMGLARTPGTPPWPRRTPDDVAELLVQAYNPTKPWPPAPQPWQIDPHPTPS